MPSDPPMRDDAQREPRFGIEPDERDDRAEDDRPDIPPFPPHDRDDAFGRPPRRGLVRLLPMLIVVVALGGFAATVWWAYRSATTQDAEPEAPLIAAEPGPEKLRPESEGGLEVPDQDKLVYEQIVPEAGRPQTERLVLPPEAPVPADAPPAEPPPPVVAAPLPEPVAPPPAIVVAPLPSVEVAATPPPEPLLPPEPPPAAVAPPLAVAAAGGVRVQLAAVRSAEAARAEWDRLQRQHGESLGALQLVVDRADLGDRGIFFRVQAGPLADRAAAAALCARLKGRDQACLVVGP